MRLFVIFIVLLFSVANAEPLPAWQTTYETPSHSLEVDVVPTRPAVDVFPVLTVEPAYWCPPVEPSGPWTAGLIHPEKGGDAFELRRESGRLPSTDLPRTHAFHAAPLDADAAYAPANALTIHDMLTLLDDIMAATAPRHFGYDAQHLDSIQVTSYPQRGGGYARPDLLTLHLFTTLRGIPLWGHVGFSLADRRDSAPSYTPGLTLLMTSPEDFELLGRTVRETGIADESVPLCTFEAVQAALAQEIIAGHIRHIYHVDLGYALYNEHGIVLPSGKGRMKGVTLYAVPTWRCVCLYMEDAMTPLPDGVLEEPETSRYLRTLFVDARTGTLLDPLDTSPDAEDYVPLP